MCAAAVALTGLTRVALAVSAGHSSVEMREGELRSEINAALSKIRAYARDMEVSYSMGKAAAAAARAKAKAAASAAPGGTYWQQLATESSPMLCVL